MKNYELLMIFKPNLDAEEVDKNLSKLEKMVKDFGGKIQSTEKLGRKKLAYEIQGLRDGFFVNQLLTIEADKISEFKRQLKLNDSIIRIMFLELSKHAQATA